MDRRIKVGIILIILVTVTVFAEGGHESDHHFNWWGFIGRVVDSTLLFGGLIFLLRKPIINLLTQKSLEVKNEIVHREEELETSSIKLEELTARLEKIQQEIENMKQEASKSGQQEKQRIEEQAQKEAQRILELTEEEIKIKVANSVRNLKSTIADLTVKDFKKDIQAQLDKKAHENIIEKNIEICGDIIERQ
jgi:F-type H+-transporting ATPase subunit b